MTRTARAGLLIFSCLLLLVALVAAPPTAATTAAGRESCDTAAPGHDTVGTDTVVLLVHGFRDDADSWGTPDKPGPGQMPDTIDTLELTLGVTARTFDYRAHNDRWVTHQRIGPRLARAIQCYADASAEQGPGKIIVVGHSMGGLATRCALNPACGGITGNEQRVGMVVTLGTPNTGSLLQRAGRFVQAGGGAVVVAKACLSGLSGWAVGQLTGLCDFWRTLLTSDASRAFVPGSSELRALPLFPANVPVHAIAGDARVGVQLFTWRGTVADAGDLVVGVDSATASTAENPNGTSTTIDCGLWGPGAVGACTHVSEITNGDFVAAVSRLVAGYVAERGCGVRNGATVVADAVATLPRPDGGYSWSTDPDEYDGNYDPCAPLSAVVLPIANGSISSARHVLLFHRGSFVRTGTDEPYAGAFLNADASDRDTVVIDYTYRRPWDPDLASASGRARLTFTWDGQAVATDDALPEELTGFTGDLLISTDGFGPAFDWGVTRAVAEEALGTTFDLLDLGGGCQQGTLAGVPHVTFAIEDGLVAAASVTEVSDIGPVPVTPTGLTLGDPVGDVTESYPDAVEDADPSDASTVRWTVTDGDRTAQFFSFDAATVSSMQFGLTNSVGEAPCV